MSRVEELRRLLAETGTWRTGRKVGRTIYRQETDALIGVMDRVPDAQLAAAAPEALHDLLDVYEAVRGARPTLDHERACATWHSDVYGDGECTCRMADLDAALAHLEGSPHATPRRADSRGRSPAHGLLALLRERDRLRNEVERLRDLLGPDYHVADIHEDGWSIQHPIPCRESMLDCDLHRVAVHDWQEPPAPVGRYRADLTTDGDIALDRLGGAEGAS